MANTVIGFEGIVAKDSITGSVPDGYEGLTWDNVGVVGKDWGLSNGFTDANGFYTTAINKACAFTQETVPGTTDASFSDSTTTFSLTKGHFASGFDNSGEEVTFTSYRNGHVVGTMTVDLTETPDVIRFGKDFKHIDKFEISGTNPAGFNSFVAMDALKVAFDPTDPATSDAAAVHGLLASAHTMVHDWLG